jgi:hypothetical protein
LESRGISIKKWLKKREKHTFYHLGGRNGILSMLQVTGCIVEQEEALGKAICLALEDVDCVVNLSDEFLRVEVTITVLARFKHDAGFSVG